MINFLMLVFPVGFCADCCCSLWICFCLSCSLFWTATSRCYSVRIAAVCWDGFLNCASIWFISDIGGLKGGVESGDDWATTSGEAVSVGFCWIMWWASASMPPVIPIVSVMFIALFESSCWLRVTLMRDCELMSCFEGDGERFPPCTVDGGPEFWCFGDVKPVSGTRGGGPEPYVAGGRKGRLYPIYCECSFNWGGLNWFAFLNDSWTVFRSSSSFSSLSTITSFSIGMPASDVSRENCSCVVSMTSCSGIGGAAGGGVGVLVNLYCPVFADWLAWRFLFRASSPCEL